MSALKSHSFPPDAADAFHEPSGLVPPRRRPAYLGEPQKRPRSRPAVLDRSPRRLRAAPGAAAAAAAALDWVSSVVLGRAGSVGFSQSPEQRRVGPRWLGLVVVSSTCPCQWRFAGRPASSLETNLSPPSSASGGCSPPLRVPAPLVSKRCERTPLGVGVT